MRNPLKHQPIAMLIYFSLMMAYLLSATFVFASEVYFQFVQSNSVLPTTWFYKFVLRWHWVILIAFLAHSVLTYAYTKYTFHKLMQKYAKDSAHRSLEYLTQLNKPNEK